MAKGKQAAAAAGRRLEAANEHIDRLTDQLAEAKLRVKLVEAQAARVPMMERELEDLRAIVAGTEEHCLAAEVADLRDRLRIATDDHERRIAVARRIVAKNLRIVNLQSRHDLRMSALEWDRLAGALDTNARDLLMTMQGEPRSFLVGPTGPNAVTEANTKVMQRTPVSRDAWADSMTRWSVDYLDEQTDEVWQRGLNTMRAILADETTPDDAEG